MPFPKLNILAQAKASYKAGLPFVLYSYPGEAVLRGVFQSTAAVQELKDFSASGFVFAPFNTDGTKILISGKIVQEALVVAQEQPKESKFILSDKDKEAYLRLLDKALTAIEAKNFKKVVLSRSLAVDTNKTADQIFEGLLTQYPQAFCYWWYHPAIGTWLGATPERLLHYQAGQISTTSLAGTLPVGEQPPQWTAKEQEEQQMVTDYIVAALAGKVSGLTVSPSQSHRAGKLWHLKSEIKARLKDIGLEGVVAALQPTPAVCGLPKAEAYNFILEQEAYQRAFYTGYLGTLNLDAPQTTRFFVNLRCLKYTNTKAQVYVGGGITAASDPEQEWQETQFKSKTMLAVL